MSKKERFTLPHNIVFGHTPSPSEIICNELMVRGWSENELAAKMGCPIETVKNIIYANEKITVEAAIKLGIAFGTSADFWLDLEKEYRLWLLKQKGE